ncbi:hypothetical protein [Thioclava indica]|uniref:hypothetical protein n=1 Tax=Thioclava indica TaxID=1353528 RepID=UPI0012DD44D5|nr:hypothetical protein [Thioclava indica]
MATDRLVTGPGHSRPITGALNQSPDMPTGRRDSHIGHSPLVSVFVEELFSGPLHSDAQTQQAPKTRDSSD